MGKLTLTYSLADQDFSHTKSLGIFNFSKQLLQVFARMPDFQRLTVLSNHTLAKELSWLDPAVLEVHSEAVGSRWRRVLWDQWGLYRAAQRAGNEWLYLPKGFPSFMRRSPVKIASFVADVMPEYYHQRFPGCVPTLEEHYFRRSLRASMRHSRIIFTNSEFTATEVARVARQWGITPPPIHATGIGFTATPSKSTADRKRLMIPVSPWPHKLTKLAVNYLTHWQKQTSFSGPVDWVGRLPADTVLPDFSNWRSHARLPETEYRQLVSESRALLYFSEYEGFGMPPVEAVLADVSPVYSDIPAMREVMAGMGSSFDNGSYESFVRAMDNALKTTPEQLATWSEKLRQRYVWDDIAAKMLRLMMAL